MRPTERRLDQEMAIRSIAAVAVDRVVALLPVLLGKPITTLPIMVRLAVERQEQRRAETAEMGPQQQPPKSELFSLPGEAWTVSMPMVAVVSRERTLVAQREMGEHLSS